MTDIQKLKILEMRKSGCGYAEIAKVLFIPRNTVKTFCRRNNIEADSRVIPLEKDTPGVCPECGNAIVQIPGHKPRRFCSSECRQKWWNSHPEQITKKAVYSYICPECGSPFSAYGNKSRKYCSHVCYINARFKGDKSHD